VNTILYQQFVGESRDAQADYLQKTGDTHCQTDVLASSEASQMRNMSRKGDWARTQSLSQLKRESQSFKQEGFNIRLKVITFCVQRVIKKGRDEADRHDHKHSNA